MGKLLGPRDVSRSYDLESLIRLTHRLSRHISDHLEGEFAAIDDVAACLRTLYAKGAGDKLIMRVVRSFHVEAPTVSFVRGVSATAGTLLELGAVPQLRPYRESDAVLSLLEWLDTPALVAAMSAEKPTPAPSKRLTWAQLINDLANVRGSHATQTMAAWIDTASLGGISGASLAEYIVESAAVVVEDRLGLILHSLGEEEHITPRRQLPVRDLGADWLRVSRANDVLDLEAQYFTSAWSKPDGIYPGLRFAIAEKSIGADVVIAGGNIVGIAPV